MPSPYVMNNAASVAEAAGVKPARIRQLGYNTAEHSTGPAGKHRLPGRKAADDTWRIQGEPAREYIRWRQAKQAKVTRPRKRSAPSSSNVCGLKVD
jgi:hypothetical protein